MKPHPFTFMHPDTGLELVKHGEATRLLRTLHTQWEQWTEAFELAMMLRSLEVCPHMNGIKKRHGGNVILKRDGRKAPNGKTFKEYLLNPAIKVVNG